MDLKKSLEFLRNLEKFNNLRNSSYSDNTSKYADSLESAIERAIPKKPIRLDKRQKLCSACKKNLVYEYYCPFCGQKVDWNDK